MKRILVGVGLAAALTWSAAADAGKPGGGSIAPAGTLVFTQYVADTANVIDLDGTDGQTLPLTDCSADWRSGTPNQVAGSVCSTHARHGGRVWFLRACSVPGSYPDGRGRRELFAVAEDNTGAVQLTDDPSLAPVQTWRADFSLDDGAIAFGACRFETDGSVVESGVYVAQVTWNADGTLAGPAATPELVAPVAVSIDSQGRHFVSVTPPQLSADLQTLVFVTGGWLTVVNRATGVATPIAESSGLATLDPAGRRIAYTASGGLHVCDVTGANKVLVISTSSGAASGSSTQVACPVWSPDSTRVAFRWTQTSSFNKATQAIRYATVKAKASSTTVPGTEDVAVVLNWLP